MGRYRAAHRPAVECPYGEGDQSPLPEKGAGNPMNSEGSVTRCIADLKAGEASAAERLWQPYFQRLVGLAGAKLGPKAGPLADEEDVALMPSRASASGPPGADSPSSATATTFGPCWSFSPAARRPTLLSTSGGRSCPGGHRRDDGLPDDAGLEAVLSREPTPELSAMVAENSARLFDRLDPALRQIAQLGRQLHECRDCLAAGLCHCGTGPPPGIDPANLGSRGGCVRTIPPDAGEISGP